MAPMEEIEITKKNPIYFSQLYVLLIKYTINEPRKAKIIGTYIRDSFPCAIPYQNGKIQRNHINQPIKNPRIR